jgi:hypothetical protein
MKIHKLVAVLATAGVAFVAPSLISADSASARPIYWGHGGSPSPWPEVVIFAGVVSVMGNAAWVWHTQCRELSSQEAMTSTFLPFIGIAFDAQASKCR